MLRRTCVLLAAMATIAAVAVSVRAAENPVGRWVGTTEVPGQGPDAVTLVITKTESGLAGTMSDSLLQVASEPLRDVKFADGVLAFGFSLTDGTAMSMRLKVEGDRMAGEWQHPEEGAGAITFERQKGEPR